MTLPAVTKKSPLQVERAIPIYAIVANSPDTPEVRYHLERTWRQVRQGYASTLERPPER